MSPLPLGPVKGLPTNRLPGVKQQGRGWCWRRDQSAVSEVEASAGPVRSGQRPRELGAGAGGDHTPLARSPSAEWSSSPRSSGLGQTMPSDAKYWLLCPFLPLRSPRQDLDTSPETEPHRPTLIPPPSPLDSTSSLRDLIWKSFRNKKYLFFFYLNKRLAFLIALSYLYLV